MRGLTRGRGTTGGLTLAIAVAAAPAHAQTAPAPPPVNTPRIPGQLPTREQVTPPQPTQAPAPTASIDARSAIPQSTCPFEDSPIRLRLNAVRFTRPDGSALQPGIAETLKDVVAPTGHQSIKVVCDLRDRANAALHRDGWVASVQIPPQSIDSGDLQLQVITARITEVRVRGAPGPYRATLERRLAQLKALDPLNEHDAEKALLLAGDLPGLDVQLSLRPAGTQPGDVIGDLLITYRPFAVLANVQNLNSRALGRETGYVRAEAYGLTGLSDLAYLGASSTTDFHEQIIVQGGYAIGLGPAGTTVGVRGIYAWSKPDLGVLQLDTRTLIAGLDLSRPLKRTLNTNIRASLGFDYVDQRTSSGTGGERNPLSLDKLRVVFGRVTADTVGRRADGVITWSLTGALEGRKGTGLFGATPHGLPTGGLVPSQIDGNARATVVRADADVFLALNRIFSLSGSARGQWANDPLLNYEEFSLGNLTIGRGYDPGSNSGDRAIGLRGEVGAALPLNLRDVDVQLFGFYDAVALTNLDRGSTERNRHLRSYGAGLRLNLYNRVLAEAIFAHPQDRALTIDDRPPPNRFLLSLTARYDARAR